MRIKARVQLVRMVKKVISEYRVDKTNLPVDVAIEVKQPTLKKEWRWRVWYIHQNDKLDEQGFWKQALLLHSCYRGGLIPNPFFWARGSVGGTCRSEKEAYIQADYARSLLLEGLKPILALSVYHELSDDRVLL